MMSQKATFQKAVEKMNKKMREESVSRTSDVSSSHIGKLLDKITGALTDRGTATQIERDDIEQMERDLHGDSEYESLRNQEKKEELKAGLRYTHAEDDLRRRNDSQATSRVETGQHPSDRDDMREYSDHGWRSGS